MAHSRLNAYGLLIAGFAVFSGIVQLTCRNPKTEDTPLPVRLPASVGDFVGESLRFCQNDQCLQSFEASRLDHPDICPACGGVLDSISLGEKQLLPADTIIDKRLYRDPSGDAFLVTSVLSGRERRSIHKPQVCLVAQGHTITGQRVMHVRLDSGRTLDVMRLDLRRPVGEATGGTRVHMTYAYWFVSAARETPYHAVRLLQSAWDGVVRNTRTRWAYISIGAPASVSDAGADARMEAIIRAVYPRLSLYTPATIE